jgi:hypothetical protein
MMEQVLLCVALQGLFSEFLFTIFKCTTMSFKFTLYHLYSRSGVAWNLRNDTFFFNMHEFTLTFKVITVTGLVVASQTTHSSVGQLEYTACLPTTHLCTDVMRRTKTSELAHPNFCGATSEFQHSAFTQCTESCHYQRVSSGAMRLVYGRSTASIAAHAHSRLCLAQIGTPPQSQPHQLTNSDSHIDHTM